jgi:hypothetical protein
MQPDTLFWTACIPSRVLLSTTPLFLPPRPLGIVLAMVATAFAILWSFNLRMDAMEAGGRGTWWHQWRIVHAALYAIAAYMLLSAEDRRAWIPLALDVVVAIVARQVSR